DSLGAHAGTVATAIAVVGGDADPRLVAHVAGLDAETLRATADALVEAELLVPAAAPSFMHPIVANAIYEHLAPGDRRAGHAAAAPWLADAGGARGAIPAPPLPAAPAADPARVAVLRDAAERAAARGAPAAALPYLRRALEEPPPAAERSATLCRL